MDAGEDGGYAGGGGGATIRLLDVEEESAPRSVRWYMRGWSFSPFLLVELTSFLRAGLRVLLAPLHTTNSTKRLPVQLSWRVKVAVAFSPLRRFSSPATTRLDFFHFSVQQPRSLEAVPILVRSIHRTATRPSCRCRRFTPIRFRFSFPLRSFHRQRRERGVASSLPRRGKGRMGRKRGCESVQMEENGRERGKGKSCRIISLPSPLISRRSNYRIALERTLRPCFDLTRET